MSIKLELPRVTELRPRLTVIGVGGAGCNAINNMISAGLTGVEFVVANTDAQSLAASSAETRIQLGVRLTEGLGAGSKPEIGEAAAEEAIEDIRSRVAGSHMVFIAAGMGGGTGTGAASVIARAAKELGVLTVGVVTKPFQFEGARRLRIAEAGIGELKKYVDTLIVIPNQNLFRIANERTTFAEAFVLADQVLYSGVACIVDLIIKDGLINLDFADVRTVMSGMGTAMMGTGEASGERRAHIAAEEAIANPLLDDVTLKGASGLLLSITGGRDMTLYEVDEAASRVRQEVDPEANIIVGATFDEALGERVRVSIVASGMARLGDTQPRPPLGSPVGMPPPVGPAAGRPAGGPWPQQHAVHSQYLSHSQPEPQTAVRHPEPTPAAGFEPVATGPGAPDGRRPQEPWRAPGNVMVEEIPPPLPVAPAAGPRPHAPREEGFIPQPPADIRRPTRRMPEVEEFPVPGQREFRAKAGQGEPGASASPAGAPVNEPRRRAGLLQRLTGRHESVAPPAPNNANQGAVATQASGGAAAPHPKATGMPAFVNRERK